MGYSGRYHAASLTAVFIALAVGILVGIGLADDVVSTASAELEQTLRGNLGEAEDEAASAQLGLDRERDYSSATYDQLAGGRLAGRRVAVVGLGGLSRDTTTDLTAAFEPTGAQIVQTAVIGSPIDRGALATSAGERFPGIETDDEQLRRLGEAVGRQLAGGGPVIDAVGDELFSRLDGNFDGVDSVVFVARASSEEDPPDGNLTALTEGLLEGAPSSASSVVAVARSDTPSDPIGPFRDAGISTIDDVDLAAGQLSVVLVLGGAQGDYGVGGDTDGIIPEIPARPTGPQS